MGVNLKATLPGILAKKHWTQERLADETGISRPDINAFANGRLEAGPDRLARIAAALEVSVLELGAPVGEADSAGRSLLDRQEELEVGLVALTTRVQRLTRRVADLERQAPPKKHRGSSDG